MHRDAICRFALVLSLLAASSSSAQSTPQWAGDPTAPFWTEANNWSNVSVPTNGDFLGLGSSLVWLNQTFNSTARVASGTYTFDRLGSLQSNVTITIQSPPNLSVPIDVTLTNGRFSNLTFQSYTNFNSGTSTTRTVKVSETALIDSLGSFQNARVVVAGTAFAGTLGVGAASTSTGDITQFEQTAGQTTVAGALTIGSTNPTTAPTALATVSGGVLSVGTSTTVQAVGSTRLTVAGGVFRTGSLTANGRLTHNGGRLEIIGGTFTPTTTAAGYSINGLLDGDNPTLAFYGPSAATANITSLAVGSTKRGGLEVMSGAELTFDAVQIGENAGSSGTVIVSGNGSRLTGTNGVAVGGTTSAAGGAGTMTVGPGGSVATPGTLSLWAGGALNVEGGKVEAGSIAANGGSVNFLSGEIELTAAATIDAALGTALLGAGRQVSSGRTLSGAALTIGTSLGVSGGTLRSDNALTNAGTLTVTSGLALAQTIVNQAGRTITVAGNGELLADAAINNAGTLVLADNQVSVNGGGLNNTGTVRGSGSIAAPLANGVTGQVQVTSGGRLEFLGASNANAGVVSVIGGEVQFTGSLSNAANTGLVTARNAILRFDGGLSNNGSLAFSTGVSDVFGNIANASTGRISVSGGGAATFYGDVAHNSANPIQVSSGSQAVFFGSVSGTGSFSGTGSVFLEGDLRPGASPGLMSFGGDLTLGEGFRFLMEIGGAARGTGYDSLSVGNTLSFGGALDVQFINGFTPTVGQEFIVASFGSRFGEFSTYGGAAGMFSGAFSGGQFVLTFTGVPEPGPLLCVGAALVSLAVVRRRRTAIAHPMA
jgi:fibronectin-binding autotransporter adhesin